MLDGTVVLLDNGTVALFHKDQYHWPDNKKDLIISIPSAEGIASKEFGLMKDKDVEYSLKDPEEFSYELQKIQGLYALTQGLIERKEELKEFRKQYEELSALAHKHMRGLWRHHDDLRKILPEVVGSELTELWLSSSYSC